jgi:hypothetical protein
LIDGIGSTDGLIAAQPGKSIFKKYEGHLDKRAWSSFVMSHFDLSWEKLCRQKAKVQHGGAGCVRDDELMISTKRVRARL